MFLTIAFYHFVSLENIKELQPFIHDFCQRNHIKGTILLANEGINGTISGQKNDIHKFLGFIKTDLTFNDKFKDLEYKESWATKNPFYRMKVRLKKEIVALGVEGVSPTDKVGKYVNPEDWNKLIEEKDIVVLDTRNKYETSIGSFKNAILPSMKNFKEFPDFIKKNNIKKDSRIAMFCTGGIRCEKASAYLLNMGFKEVLHLHGGIIKYLEKVSEENSKWEGECFVFDNRVSIEQGLKQGNYLNCNGCGEPLKKEEVFNPKYKKGVSCPKCYDGLTKEKIKKSSERQKQVELSKQKGEVHIGE